MRILGIDPGLNITGYGLIDVKNNKLVLIEAGVIKTTLACSLIAFPANLSAPRFFSRGICLSSTLLNPENKPSSVNEATTYGMK